MNDTARRTYAADAGYEVRNAHGSRLLLLLHGLGGDRDQALKLVKGYALPGTAVLAPDARAHGTTQVIGDASDFSFESMVDDTLELLNGLNVMSKPTVVAGISMGAALALRLLIRDVLDVRGAVFVRPAFNDTPYPSNLTAMSKIAALLNKEGAEVGLATYIDSEEYRRTAAVSQAAAASQCSQFTALDARARAIRLAEIPRNTAYNSASELDDVRQPALVIGVSCDPEHPIDLAREWANHLPNSSFVEAPPRDKDKGIYDRFLASQVCAWSGRHLENVQD